MNTTFSEMIDRLTATRQSATARELPVRNGKPPRNDKSTLTP